MRNLLIEISYCGTRYHGFQVQTNAITVCEVFQDAVERLFGSRLDVKGCSRTDTGVHAKSYMLSMLTDSEIECRGCLYGLNRYLPHDIAVLSVREVPEDFHARYSCTGKEYVYRILNSRVKDPFSPNLAYRFGYDLDVDMLNSEAQGFVGTHDFASFQSAGSDVTDTVRTIHSFTVHREGDYVVFTVSGNGFLYNMVRILVGTLVFISMGRIDRGSIPKIIAARDRQRGGKTMPPQGLYLNRVFYDIDLE